MVDEKPDIDSDPSHPPSDAPGRGFDQAQKSYSWRGPSAIVTYVVLAALALFATIPAGNAIPDPTEVIVIGLVLGLAAMLTCITALLRTPLRFVFIVVAMISLGLVVHYKLGPPDWSLFLLPPAIGIPILATLEIIKKLSGRFRFGSFTADSREGLQFGIKHLLLATTVAAILTTIGNTITPYVKNVIAGGGIFSIFLTITVVMSFNTILGVWAILGRNAFKRIWICLILEAGVITGISCFWIVRMWHIWIVIFTIASVSILILLGTLRLEGYRFVKR